MSSRAIIYGNIVDQAELRRVTASHPDAGELMVVQDSPEPVELGQDQAVVYVDLDDPRFSEADFLRAVASDLEKVTIVGKLDQPDMDEAIRVSKLGVSEIITADEILTRLNEFMEQIENPDISEKQSSQVNQYSVNALIGKSPAVANIRKTIMLLSDVDFPSALILGETGTGKGLVSKILHNTGVRSDHSLVEVNCSAIPDELFESELFGHIKGAFTDAKNEKIGLFEYAENGTLFLDEVGSLTLAAQAKLLKILEDKKLRRVGDVSERSINVRVVAATNLDLKQAIDDNIFRDDLYFRLNLMVIEIPPLRERLQDLPELIAHYLRFYSTLYNMPNVEIHDDALEAMNSYHWPGNVRELSNVIERAVLLTKGKQIKARHVEMAFKNTRLSIQDRQKMTIDLPPRGITLEKIEQDVVLHVLNMFDWNKTETAKYLGISRPRLRRILEKTGLEQNRRKR